MKITGIALVVLGALSLLGSVISAMEGHEIHLRGLGFIALGLFLIHRAKDKEENKKEKRRWMQGDSNGES